MKTATPRTANPPPIVPAIVGQHVEESDFLHALRTAACRAAHLKLGDLRRVDDRLGAHLRGLTLAGESGWSFCESALAVPTRGAVFTAAVNAIEQRRNDWLEWLCALAKDDVECQRGLISAFGWLEPKGLQGIVAALLRSEAPFRRLIAFSACAVHRVDPRLGRDRSAQDSDPTVRARVLRTSGELGLREMLSACESAIADEPSQSGLWAAWSAVMLGNRGIALEALTRLSSKPIAHRARAFGLMLQASSPGLGHKLLQELARTPEKLRWLLLGSGINGDPSYVSWQISHMANDEIARLAGEAFSLITGADLGLVGLVRASPRDFESGPNDDPNDPNVEVDPSEGLPWPDPDKITDWWSRNRHRFQPGTRYFMGAPVTREHCIDVLKNGYQRQRILAAHYLCLLNPGTPLFNTSAPAWRQQKLLAEMK